MPVAGMEWRYRQEDYGVQGVLVLVGLAGRLSALRLAVNPMPLPEIRDIIYIFRVFI